MSWYQVTLGDIADFSNGINFDKTAYAPGVKLIGVSNFGNRFAPDYDELAEVKTEAVRQGDYLKDGDIVFVRSNGNKELVGRCMLIKDIPTPTTFSGFCICARIRDVREHDPVYWTYHFKNGEFRKTMAGSVVGANIQNLSQGRLSTYQTTVPDISTQKRIAGILSAYDDLIENNRKQIKLMEEAAQRLYKEWFVDLRFPGHETTPIVDGVPEGWSNAVVTDLLEIKYGKDHKTLEDGNIPVYGSGGIMRRVNKILHTGESVLIPRKGSLNNILLVSGDFWTIDTMFFSIPRRPNVAKYVYLFLSGVDMYAMNIGAAVPSMTVKVLDGMKVLCPSPEILEQFEKIVEPYYSMIELLKNKNEALSESRNLLIPKLMSGEIEV